MAVQQARIKTDAPGFERDPTSSALVRTDNQALNAYKKRRSQEKNIRKAVEEIDTIKGELAEIRSMVSQLLDKNKDND